MPPPSLHAFEPHALRQRWQAMVDVVDHVDILRTLSDDGRLTGRYLFMVAMAAGIATIGLLLNSPAVIIGAMLISPLMGPIALAGAGLATVNTPRLRAGGIGLLAGTLFALAVAGLIVLLSPIRDATPEILARTRPNLFDLIVAVLSGLAGGYATVRGKGGAVVGVAIATALMPPLAVAAYGLVTGQYPLAQGAAFLYLTNLVAIAVSIAAVLSWFGFARRQTRSKFAWQTALGLLILAPLAFPLSASLEAIVSETVFAREARAALLARAGKDDRIESLSFAFPERSEARLDALLLVREAIPDLDSSVSADLEARTGRRVDARVAQIEVANPRAAHAGGSALGNPIAPSVSITADSPAMPPTVFPFAVTDFARDPQRRTLLVAPAADPAVGLDLLRRLEQDWQRRYPDWTIRIVAPLSPLPSIAFAENSAVLTPAARDALDTAVWALRGWGASNVAVTGFASSRGEGPPALAGARAQAVAAVLREAGLTVRPDHRYPVPNQRELERRSGLVAFQRVDLTYVP